MEQLFDKLLQLSTRSWVRDFWKQYFSEILFGDLGQTIAATGKTPHLNRVCLSAKPSNYVGEDFFVEHMEAMETVSHN